MSSAACVDSSGMNTYRCKFHVGMTMREWYVMPCHTTLGVLHGQRNPHWERNVISGIGSYNSCLVLQLTFELRKGQEVLKWFPTFQCRKRSWYSHYRPTLSCDNYTTIGRLLGNLLSIKCLLEQVGLNDSTKYWFRMLWKWFKHLCVHVLQCPCLELRPNQKSLTWSWHDVVQDIGKMWYDLERPM